MRFTSTLVAGLLGCTMLSGCNGSDSSNVSDKSAGSFQNENANPEAEPGVTPESGDTVDETLVSKTGSGDEDTAITAPTPAGMMAALEKRLTEMENHSEAQMDESTIQALQAQLAQVKTEFNALLETNQSTSAESRIDRGTTDNFKMRMAALEDTIYKLLNPREDIPRLTRFVNPFVGTTDTTTGGGHSGNLNPGAQTPFGMVSFGPNTGGSGDYGRGVNGYLYDSTRIEYFSMTHLNGPGCRGQGAVAMFPTAGGERTLAGSSFKHEKESAEPGFYRIKLENEVTSEFTATLRTGSARFTWPDKDKAVLVINSRVSNGRASIGLDRAGVKIADDRQSVSGKTAVMRFCGGKWEQPVYFHATFNKKLMPASSDKDGLAVLQFDVTEVDKSAEIKIGISSVSEANARQNLETESGKLTFDEVKAQSSRVWNERLNTIQLDLAKPGEVDRLPESKRDDAKNKLQQFYTAFYRVYSGPTVFSDGNGDYRSMKQVDLGAAEHSMPLRATENVANYKFRADGKDAGYKTHYSGFSMWDTYRSAAQLVALIAPDEASDMMQSLVADAQQCGALPHWVDGSEDTTPMEGDHAPNVIAGSYMFGAKKFDLDNARKFMRQSAFDTASSCNNKSSVQGRLANYMAKGYIPAAESDHASSNTLEMITSDRSIGAFLQALPATAGADQGDITGLFTRAANWKNIFDDTSKTLKAKNAAGAFEDGEFHETTEPNYLWSFAQDWTTLIDKLGGKPAAIKRLNTLFSIPESTPFTGAGAEPTGRDLNGGESSNDYYIGNEPAFQTPWAYNWAGAPQYAQYIIPIIMRKNFLMEPGGLPGNDDMGATSVWYVWAALGLYPVVPSAPGLAVSTPQFAGATVWLGNGKKLRIETDREALLDNIRYINEMKLDGATYQGSWLPLDRIGDGGKLSFTLSATPTEWGAADALTPPSGPDADYSKATAKEATGLQVIQ